MTEIWKDIEGYEGYQVSNQGNVKKVAELIKNKDLTYEVPATLLRPHINNGYLYVNFKGRTFSIHRLVGKAFVPNPDNKFTLIHKDGNKLNNVSDNLEWITRGFPKNVRPHTYKGKPVKCIETGKVYSSMKEASIDTGISNESVSNSAYTGKSVKGNTFTFV